MLRDLRYGIRMLGKTPLLTGVAVAVLALGLGANTAVFSYVNALFLRPLPLPEPDRLVRVYGAADGGSRFDTFSYANYVDLRDRSRTLADLAAHQQITVSLGAGPFAEAVSGEIVTGNYFQVMGVQAAVGRMLTPADDPGEQSAVVISDAMWRGRFGADPEIVGTVVRLNGHPFAVVGVAPPWFRGTFDALAGQLWVPMSTHEQARPRGISLDQRGWGWLGGTGRLADGIGLDAAREEMVRLAGQLAEEHPRANRGWKVELFRAAALPEEFRTGVSGFLGFFALVATLVVAITCTNLSGVFLARVVARRREIAVRQSLGASRGALLRQWVTESVLLSVLGGIAGVILALWMEDAILTLAPPFWTSFAPDLSMDGRVLAFAGLAALATGLLFGLMPSIRASGFEVAEVLKDESGGGVSPRSRLFGASVLVQVTLSLVLLVVAGLFLRTLVEADSFDPGFDSDRIAVAAVDLRRHGYDEAEGREFYRQVLERLRATSGVESATFGLVVPLGTSRESMSFQFPGHVNADGSTGVPVAYNVVASDYFRTMGIPILRGRGFEDRDAAPDATPVAILNETAARRYFSGEDPIGRSIQVTGGPALQVIGVARDIKYYSLGEEPRPYVYGSSAQFYFSFATFHARAAADPTGLLPALREAIAAVDPSVAAAEVMTVREMRRIPLFPQVALARVSTLFGLLALGLTALGIYGVVSYSVNHRTRELGVRLALGARRGDILRAVLARTMGFAAAGLVLGMVSVLAAGKLLAGQLFGVTPADPATFLGVTLLLALVAALASYLPARRATRLDPVATLRYE